MKSIQRFKASLTSAPSCKLGESPLWYDDELWYVDIELGILHRFNPVSETSAAVSFDSPLACCAKHERGFVVCGKSGFLTVNIDGSAHGAESQQVPEHGCRMNDGAVDPLGRFWAGSMDGSAKGRAKLFRHGTQQSFATGLNTANGLAFSPDGKHMYLSDSHPSTQMVWRFEYDLFSAIPSRPVVFADFRKLDGRPDGATVDAEGHYWIAAIDAGCVYRFSPEGRLDMCVEVPVAKPTKPVFGGKNLSTMYITSLQVDGEGGGVYAVDLPVQGLLTPMIAAGESQSI
ncbi:MAG: SMP-30/gluconolactonase/LRE family protein [Gammaproteobacteria bacterium]|nr:SMP-30/gluconolactonase/LRE family protein [Gammaproteobacteria bacterium]